MTEIVAPQENQLELPEYWTGQLLPLRGRRTGEPVVLGSEAVKRVRGITKWYATELRTALALPENQAYAAAGLRHLDGEVDPVGAAAVAALLRFTEKRLSFAKASAHAHSGIRPELDAWTIEHGLTFAVRATITLLSLSPWNSRYHSGSTELAQRAIETMTMSALGSLFNELHEGIAAVRGLLATAPEAEYAAIVAAVEQERTDPCRRFIVSLLFPEQQAWAEESCREFEYGHYTHRLLWEVVGSPAMLAATGQSRFERWDLSPYLLGTLLDRIGAAGLPILTASLRQQLDAEERGLLLEAIAVLPSDAAMAYLVDGLPEANVFPHAAAAAERFPRRALRTIAARSADIAPELRPLLAALAARVPEPARAGLTDAERSAITTLLASSTAIPEAAVEDLPPLLSSPPWTVKRAKPKPVVIEGLEALDEYRVSWAPGEQDEWSVAENYFSDYDEADWNKRILSAATRDGGRMFAIALTYAPLAIAATALDRWDGAFSPYTATDLRVILARFETAVAQRVLIALRANPNYHEALVPILGPDAARLAAEWFGRLKTARVSAVAWFDRHGADAARLLVPDALGGDKKRRQAAEAALLFMAVRLGPETVTKAAAAYGPEAAQAIADLLDGDPLEPRGVKLPKPGSWADPAMLPQVRLADAERSLPPASVRHLVTVLALANPEYPYAGLDVVAEACDRASLARFGRALFQLWLAAGGPSKDGWALTQLAHFADDDTVRLLAPKVREWPGLAHHKRAVNGLGVLGAIGTETALRAIQGIAEKVKFKALKEEANVQITAIAAGLGLSRDQLADRLVPDYGLGDDPLVLDYGPRRFTVVFDEQLKPYVTDEDGKPRKSLPKPGAKDDPAVAEPAYQRFSLLKKELRTAATDQVARLEAAMVNARTWNADEFRRFFAVHPLVKHLARRLVWLAEADGVRVGFRIAEDGSYGDAADEVFTLPENAAIRVAHPIFMEPKELEAWGEILADYEILQPFDQLGRPVMAFTAAELATGRLERFEGVEVEVGKLLGLTKRGWHRASPEDGGVEPGVYYPLPNGGTVSIALDPGIWVGMIAENPIQKLDSVRVGPRATYWYGAHDPQPIPEGIDPLTASEILTALTTLTASK